MRRLLMGAALAVVLAACGVPEPPLDSFTSTSSDIRTDEACTKLFDFVRTDADEDEVSRILWQKRGEESAKAWERRGVDPFAYELYRVTLDSDDMEEKVRAIEALVTYCEERLGEPALPSREGEA